MTDQEERYVFISNVRENQEQDYRLCQNLENHGVEIWLGQPASNRAPSGKTPSEKRSATVIFSSPENGEKFNKR